MAAGGCRYQFRIALLGDAAVGKTSLLRRYVAGAPGAPEPEPESEWAPTVGVEFYSRKLQLRAGPRVKLQLWDTAGHERFRCGPGGLRDPGGRSVPPASRAVTPPTTTKGSASVAKVQVWGTQPCSLALHVESFVPQMQPGGPSPRARGLRPWRRESARVLPRRPGGMGDPAAERAHRSRASRAGGAREMGKEERFGTAWKDA